MILNNCIRNFKKLNIQNNLIRNYCSINKNENVIEILKSRGFIHQMTESEEVMKSITDKKKITFYTGFDPTADSLHIGNLLTLMVMSHFKRQGHNPIAIVGGATALIGDPSGKSTDRPVLTEEFIENNLKYLKENIKTILGQDTTILNNIEWNKNLSIINFLRDIGIYFRVGTMIKKDFIQNRLNSENDDSGISYTEFTYSLLQANDFAHLYQNNKCELQIGGSDQWGNIVSGIDLIRKKFKGQGLGLTIPLLTNSEGQKLGKSEGNSIWLSPHKTSAYMFYQYWIQIADADVEKLLKLFTYLSLDEISNIVNQHNENKHLRIAQKKLAEEITRLIHGQKGLEEALLTTEILFGKYSDALSNLDENNNCIIEGNNVGELLSKANYITLEKSKYLNQKLVNILSDVTGVSSTQSRKLITDKVVFMNSKLISDPKSILTEKDLINNHFILLKSVILIIIKLSYSKIIQFDNSVIDTCTASTPCSLLSNSVWVNSELPTDGDSIVIDFSSLNKNSKNQSINLIGSDLNIKLASFYLNGATDIGWKSSNSYFEVVNTLQVIIKESNKESGNQIAIDNFISNEVNLLIQDYAIVQASNLTLLSESNTQTVISGSSIVKATQFINITAPIIHDSINLLAFTGNGVILNSILSNGLVQMNNITIGEKYTTTKFKVYIDTLYLDGLMVIYSLNVVSIKDFKNNHRIIISPESILEIEGTINNQTVINGIDIVVLGQLLLPSGFTIGNIIPPSNLVMLGTIIIKDCENPTYLIGNNVDLDIKSPGSVVLNNSTFNKIQSDSLDIRSNSTIGQIICTNTTIEQGVYLSLKFTSNCTTMNVYGFLATQSLYNVDTINVFENGRYFASGNVNANINSNSTLNFASYQTTNSITSGSDGIIVLQFPGLTINGSLSLEKSQMKLYFLGYNSPEYPSIKVNGNASVNLSSLYIETQYLSGKPMANDRLYLLKSNGSINFNVKNSDIAFSNFQSSPFNKGSLDYKVIQDKDGYVYIEFNGTNRALIIALSIVIPLVVVVAAVVLVMIIKNRRSKDPERRPFKHF